MREVVTEVLSAMARVLGNAPVVDGELVLIWEAILEDAGISENEIRQGMRRVMQTERFFPTPAVFIEAVRPKENLDLAVEWAWQQVRTMIREVGAYGSLHVSDFNGDGTALWTIDRIGWERLCAEMTEDKIAFWRQEFSATYKAGLVNHAAATYVPGRMERENAHRNRDLTPALVGRPQWKELPTQAPPPLALPSGPRGELSPVLRGAAIGRDF